MFGGHIPEEPARDARGGGGDFGVKLDPKKMPEALKDGTVNEAAITRAAGRVLYEIVHFGYLDGQQKHEVTAQSIEANAKIIEKTGEEAAVLLKNEDGALPLKAADLDSVVLIGPTAGQVDSIGINGERSVGLPQRQVGPLAALKKITGNAKIQLRRGRRHDRHDRSGRRLSHDGKPGLDTHRLSARRRSTRRSTSPAATPCRPTRPSPGRARSHRLTPASTGSICRPWAPTPDISLDGKGLAGTGASPGRRAWRHSASQPGQRHSHHRRPRQCAPRG